MPSPATMDLADPNLLCPTNTIKTVVPLTARAQPSEKISATVCSEFREIARQVSPFSATQCTRLVLDFQDEPMVFTVGKDLVPHYISCLECHSHLLQRFYCVRHITGPGWTSYDITPGVQGATVTAFDVIQHINNKIAIVVAVSSSVPNATDLYYVSPFTPTKDLDISRKFLIRFSS